MRTIINQKLFDELKSIAKKGEDVFSALFTGGPYPEVKDEEIPTFAGGLDHVEVKARGIYFYDIGCSRGGHQCDASFVIRPEL